MFWVVKQRGPNDFLIGVDSEIPHAPADLVGFKTLEHAQLVVSYLNDNCTLQKSTMTHGHAEKKAEKKG